MKKNALMTANRAGGFRPGPTVSPAAKVLLASLSALALIACGYSLRGTGSFLPPNIKKIQIPIFVNRTTRYELDKRLTQSVHDEFVARGKVEITSDAKLADAVLNGVILSFNAAPSGFSREGSADHYTIYIVTSIELVDAKSKAVIYANPSYVFNEDYEVPQGKDFESVQTEALKKIAEKYARNLVIAILEGF
jgi:outer membrane lipopolysaccharide assembly protein LptE/RlpB